LQDLKGQQIARSFGNLGLRGDRWWFKHFINNNNQPFFSKSYYSLTGNKPVISIFHPVVHNDTTIGILGLDINFDEIQKYIEKNLSDTNMYAIVVDNEGIIIAHPQRQYLQEIHNIRTLVKERLIFTPDGKPVFDLNRNHKTQKLSFNWDKQISICADNAAAGNSGYLANAKIENTNNFIFYTPINFSINTDNGKKYVVLLIRSADSIYYKQNFYIVLTLSISILLSIIAYLLCKRIIEKKIINPILKLTEYMNAYQANGYSQNNIEIEENNELKYMLAAFKNMISAIEEKTLKLENYKKHLEDMVAERTAELQKMNKNLETEIEEKNKAYFEILKLKTAIEQSANAVVITDIEGNIIYVNSAFEHITGYTSYEAFGKNPRILKSNKHSKEFYEKLWNTIISGNIWRGEICNKKKDGALYWEMMTITPIKNEKNEILNYLAIKEDITEEKENIDKLKIAMQNVERANAVKNAFLANISHEIRTPMNAIIGFTNLCSIMSELTEKQKSYIEKIQSAAFSLMQTMDNILYISRIEAGDLKLEYTDFNIDDELTQVIQKIKQEALNKKIDITFKRDPLIPKMLIGDAVRLQRVLLNLGNNAVKYTHRGSVTIEADLLQQTEEKVLLRFAVIDTGEGIPISKLHNIFDYFYQVDNSTTKRHSGVGIGLTIANKIVAMMDGKLKVKSAVGKGSEFYFDIWLEKSKKTQNQESANNKEPEKKLDFSKNILVVDDNEINREVAYELLTAFKFKVDTAANGIEALQKIEEKKYALILMDIYMPELDGIETTIKLREKFNNEELPIIALTASIMPEEIPKLKKIGMNDVIIKPIVSKHLYKILSKYLKANIKKKEDDLSINQKDLIKKLKDIAPFINIDIALKTLSGNTELFINILTKFYNNHCNDVEKLETAINNSDNKNAYIVIHTLKGLTANIGAIDINNELKKIIVDKNKSIDLNAAKEILSKLKTFFTDLSVALKSINLLKFKVVNISEKDNKNFKAYLLELAEYLDSNDSRSIEILKVINATSIANNEYSADISQISKFIEKYQFKKALELVKKILEKFN